MAKTTKPWNKIKKDYLEGVTPKELSKKYKFDNIDELYKYIENHKWASELREIQGNVGNEVQNRIKCLTNLALDTLVEVIKDEETEKNVKVSACKAILDISGLKSIKQDVTGIDGVSVIINREAVHVESNN